MPGTDWLLALSYAFHLVATVIWIGGLLLMSLFLWPEARAILGEGANALFDRARKRFYPVANLSLFVLLATGLFQMSRSPHYEGLLKFTNDWSRAILLKHIAVIGMLGIGAVMQWGLIPALDRAALLISRGKPAPELEALRRRERRLNILNGALGIFVLVCTAVASAV